jgi:hypothetical protein
MDTSAALVSLYDYEVATKRILSGPAWDYHAAVAPPGPGT